MRTAAALAAVQDRIRVRRAHVAALLAHEPTLSTDEIARRLGYDRSTIRRDRAAMDLTAR